MHPYGIHKMVNRDTSEVVKAESDDKGYAIRWAIIRNGNYEAWVQIAKQDQYGYELRPNERVSPDELDAINLKHAAIRDGSKVTVEEVRSLIDSGRPEQISHALIALYYAAKADSSIPDVEVSRLRKLVQDQTGHVDSSHIPTVMSILEDVLGDESGNEAV